jgi:predicted transcriptional regulator
MNNTEKVIDILRQHGAMRICDLMRKSGVKNAYQIVNDLTKNGRVIKQKLSGQYVKVSLPEIKSESSNPPPKKVAHPLERHRCFLSG